VDHFSALSWITFIALRTRVVLEVSVARLRAAGREVFIAPNGVILARDVPPHCVVNVHAGTKRARDDLPHMRRLFGLGTSPR
jgi:putative RNA 2'-phosphotransferase